MESKILQLFKNLTTSELTLLGKFINSVYFNNSGDISNLFKYLQVCHPTFNKQKLEKKTIHDSLFPNDKFNSKKTRDLMSDLYLLILRFLVEQDFKNGKGTYLLILKTLKDRNNYLLFKREFEKIKKKRSSIKDLRDMNLIHEDIILNEWFYMHPGTHPFRRGLDYPKQMMNNLDEYYFLGKLRYACELLSREKTLREEHNIELLGNVIELCSNHDPNTYPLIFIYRGIVLFLKDQCVSPSFASVKKCFVKNIKKISPFEARTILQYLLNFTIDQINQGIELYKYEQFELYDLAMKNNFILINGSLSHMSYVNIAILGAGLKKIRWTEKFMKDYLKFINDPMSANASFIANAYMTFAKGKFSSASDWAGKVNTPEYRYKLWARSIKSRASFELALKGDADFLSLLDELKNFLVFIKRGSDIPKNKREPYINYIAILKKLSLYYLDESKSGDFKTNILSELKSIKKVISKSWLIEKIEQIK